MSRKTISNETGTRELDSKTDLGEEDTEHAATEPAPTQEDVGPTGKDHPANQPRKEFFIAVNGNAHGRDDRFTTREEAEKVMNDLRGGAGPDAQALPWTVEEREIPPAK